MYRISDVCLNVKNFISALYVCTCSFTHRLIVSVFVLTSHCLFSNHASECLLNWVLLYSTMGPHDLLGLHLGAERMFLKISKSTRTLESLRRNVFCELYCNWNVCGHQIRGVVILAIPASVAAAASTVSVITIAM